MGNGGLMLSDLGAVEEWLAFNASVRRAGERKGRLSFTSKGGLERGGDCFRGFEGDTNGPHAGLL